MKTKTTESLNGAARFRKWYTPWFWVVPPTAVVVIFYIYPFLRTLVTSFTDTRPSDQGFGNYVALENYTNIFTDYSFWPSVGYSVLYAVCVVPLLVFLPLLVALLVRDYVPGVGVFRALYYVPAICSLVVISLAWRSMLKPQGALNNLLVSSGIISSPIPFLSNSWLILFCAMIITVWQMLPYYMILYLAALANVDRNLYEAAALDGAGAIRRFWTVTVPGVKVMMYLVGVLSTISAFRVFTEVYLLGGENSPVTTITMYIRNQIDDPVYGSLGIGSAASVFLFLMTFGFIILSNRLQAKAEEQ